MNEFDANQRLELVGTERGRWHAVLKPKAAAPEPIDNRYDYIEPDFALRLAAAARVKARAAV